MTYGSQSNMQTANIVVPVLNGPVPYTVLASDIAATTDGMVGYIRGGIPVSATLAWETGPHRGPAVDVWVMHQSPPPPGPVTWHQVFLRTAQPGPALPGDARFLATLQGTDPEGGVYGPGAPTALLHVLVRPVFPDDAVNDGRRRERSERSRNAASGQQ